MNASANDWLKYWRNTLANADRKNVEVIIPPVQNKEAFIDIVPPSTVKLLQTAVPKNIPLINVDICPCAISLRNTNNGKSLNNKEGFLYPFWIPAIMDKNGKLFPNKKPFFVRDYLSPNPNDNLTISSVYQVDKVLNEYEFKRELWKDHWFECEDFFKKITNQTFLNFNHSFNPTHNNLIRIYIQNGTIRNTTFHVIRLYNDLLKQLPKSKLLETFINPNPAAIQPFPSRFNINYNTNHLGQMNDEFPLSKSQRISIAAYSAIKNGEVLAVNGPPGTGKTTLLQSIVANSVVNAVIKGEDNPPELIIASSTNNQAITNILDSFKLKTNPTSNLADRWLPELDSLGLYFSNSNKKDKEGKNKYQQYKNSKDSFINEYEKKDFNYLKQTFLDNYKKYFGECDNNIELCKRALRIKIIQKVDKIKLFLNRTKHLSVEKIADPENSNNMALIKRLHQNELDKWNQKYQHKLTQLHLLTKDEYQNLKQEENINVQMDISLRFEAFWLAIHYREADYLTRVKYKLEKFPNSREDGEKFYKLKLERIACLTPIFISTFHSLPKYATYKNSSSNWVPYYNLFDLIIVDEAGQVTPDISIPSFSLAKKAVVVGDVYQIEPVYPVSPEIDRINLANHNIISPTTTLDDFIGLTEKVHQGKFSSFGNLMQVAQFACSFKEGNQRGTILREHRRCLDPIISFCNDYVYDQALIPMKGFKHDKQHDLPAKGFLNITSHPIKKGTSQVNDKEAHTIAHWINEKKEQLISAYNKPIEDIVAIVTPYKAQSLLIKKHLKRINDNYKNIISGTVHALQGAEKEIVIFSTVLSKENNLQFINNLNIINVAISRAKHSFLVFGNIDILDASNNTPLGNLKKWLIEDGEGSELSSKILFEGETFNRFRIKELGQCEVQSLNSLQNHRDFLKYAFTMVDKELIIISPFISINAIEADLIIELAEKANNRGVKLTIITDAFLDKARNLNTPIIYKRKGEVIDIYEEDKGLKIHAAIGRKVLRDIPGLELKIVNGIHEKTVIIDDKQISQGSFNWLSATRDQNSLAYRQESSFLVSGGKTTELIASIKKKYKLDRN